MTAFLSDLRHAFRAARRSPGFAITVILVLALGIGATSALFSAIDQTVIRPLPYVHPDRLVMLWEDFSAFGVPKSRVSPATFFDLRRQSRSFEQIAAYAGPRTLDLSGGGSPEEVLGMAVTANLLPMLGVQPLLGRTLLAGEEGPGSRVAVLSYGLWRRRFGGDPGLVGKQVLMNAEPYTIAGIMPPGFAYPDRETELWIPLGLSPELAARRNSHFLKVVGRIRQDRTFAEARGEMSSIAAQIARDFPQTNGKVGITTVPLKEEVLGSARSAFLLLLAASGCVLLIACSNVANMLLARISGRRDEMAIRTALGASRGRMLRQALTENLALSSIAGLLGLVLAAWIVHALRPLAPTGLAQLAVDGRALSFSVGAAIFTALASGFAPALQFTRIHIAGRGVVGRRGGLRDLLVVAEIAAALVLAIGAVLLVRSLGNMRAVDAGFRYERILTAEINAPHPKYADSRKRRRYYSNLLERMRAIPGVEAAGLTSDLPYTSRGNTMSLKVEGAVPAAGVRPDILFRLVSAGYLETIGARLRTGRFLAASDTEDSLPVVVVTESLARQYWPGQNPLGRRIDTGTGDGAPLWMSVVGVVSDIRERGLDLGVKPAAYVPFRQTPIGFFQPSEAAVRTSRDPLGLARDLQAAVWSEDPDQPVTHIRTLSEIVDDELAGRSQVLAMLGAFAAAALLLAALGIYGVLSYNVSRRTREIGLRMALGANRWNVVRSVTGYAGWLTAGGLCLGLAASAVATRLLATLLYGVSPLDAASFLIVSAGLGAIALVASYLPARRATLVDPLAALRSE